MEEDGTTGAPIVGRHLCSFGKNKLGRNTWLEVEVKNLFDVAAVLEWQQGGSKRITEKRTSGAAAEESSLAR